MTAATSHNGNLEHLRVVVFREGDVYVAQCLEVDISTQARDIPDLIERLDLTIDAECSISKERGLNPFEGIGPAPNYFHSLWEKHSPRVGHFKFPVGHHFQTLEVAFAKAA